MASKKKAHTPLVSIPQRYPGYSGWIFVDIENKKIPALFSCLHKTDERLITKIKKSANVPTDKTRFITFLYRDPVIPNAAALVICWGFGYNPSALYSAWINPCSDDEIMRHLTSSDEIHHCLVSGDESIIWVVENKSKEKISMAYEMIKKHQIISTDEQFKNLKSHGIENNIALQIWRQNASEKAEFN
jgi:hypothetical protein